MAGRFLTLGLAGLLLLNECSSRRSEADIQKRHAEIETRLLLAHPVELIDSTALQHLIHGRHGKVLLLNIWATWCQPCTEEFPDLIKLSEKNPLVEVVGISVDYPDEINSKVIPFLAKLRVPFQVYVAKFEKQEDFISMIDSEWNGAVPATYMYDRQGTQRLSMIGEQQYDQFKKAISRIH